MLDVNVGDPAGRRDRVDAAAPSRSCRAHRPAALHRLVRDRGARGRARRVPGQSARKLGHRRGRRLEADSADRRGAWAAVIGLVNDDGSRWSAERRLEVARQDRLGRRGLRHSARGRADRPTRDAGRAEPRAVTLFLETVRLIRDDLGVNMTCGASNTSFGLPGRQTLGAAFLAVRREPRPDERDHGCPLARDRRGGAGDRLPAGHGRVGCRTGSRHIAQAGGRAVA